MARGRLNRKDDNILVHKNTSIKLFGGVLKAISLLLFHLMPSVFVDCMMSVELL